MQTLQTINKTETYDKRKEFNVSHPDEQRHIDMTNLIDDYIEVALHMKKIRDIHQEMERSKKIKRGKDFDFQSYINIYGINEDDTGTLQTNGFYIDGKMTPFVSWTDDYHTKYSLYHGKILEDIFKAIFTVGISHEEIVKVVEERDMWYNS